MAGKSSIREADPQLADLLNKLSVFKPKAIAVKVGDEIIYRTGIFDPVRDMSVIVQQRKWG